MAKAASPPVIDVLVLGDHPAAHLCALILHENTKLKVVHATLPDEELPDRLTMINPALFDLHPSLSPLRRKLDLTSIYGLNFLAEDPASHSEYRNKSIMALVGHFKDMRVAMAKVSADAGVQSITPKHVEVHRIDEKGLTITLGKTKIYPKVLVLAGPLPAAQQKILGMPEGWGNGLVHRYTWLKFRGTKSINLGGKPVVPMSLDLNHKMSWAWLLPHDQHIQLAVEQPLSSPIEPLAMLKHWVMILKRHGVLAADVDLPWSQVHSMNIPMAGALEHEGLANRTVLIGPAGGFYSACAEDLYPNMWSAVFAADAINKAIKETHIQDALQPYRQKWRTTLGDYLRGPHQNLKFLLPLVYRNQVMTTRMTEAILLGKGMVR